MDIDNDIVIPHVPVVAGGVYESRNEDLGTVDQMLCIATHQNKAGQTLGLFRRYGMADQRLAEGDEDLAGWVLVYGPGVKVSSRTGKPTRAYAKPETNAK